MMKRILLASLLSLLMINGCLAESKKTCPQLNSKEALNKLIEGNNRFTHLKLKHPDETFQRRHEIVSGQHPFAVILSCSDSRVPPELVFDQGLGDLFVIRDAGNILDDIVIGSIEYAVGHLDVPLVIVLGHEDCGAVTAAVHGHAETEHIHKILEEITPSIKAVENNGKCDNLVNCTVIQNVKEVVSKLKNSEPVLSQKVKEGKVTIIGAYYHLEDGKVEFIK